MVEEEICGPDLKRALSTKGIFCCYLDDFYTGNIEDIKQKALFKEMQEYIQSNVNLNINEMYEHALLQTRIETTESEEKQFFNKYVKTLQFSIYEEGDLVVEFKKR